MKGDSSRGWSIKKPPWCARCSGPVQGVPEGGPGLRGLSVDTEWPQGLEPEGLWTQRFGRRASVCPSISRTHPEPSWWNVAYIQLILDQSSKAGWWGSGEMHICEDPWAEDHITTGYPACSPLTRLRECDQCPPTLWGSNSSQRQWNGPVAPRPFLDPHASIFNSSTKHNGICDPSILLSWLFQTHFTKGKFISCLFVCFCLNRPLSFPLLKKKKIYSVNVTVECLLC